MCILYSLCSMYSVFCVLCILCILYSVYSVICILCILYSLYSVFCILSIDYALASSTQTAKEKHFPVYYICRQNGKTCIKDSTVYRFPSPLPNADASFLLIEWILGKRKME